jgi:carbonic anhydrase
MSRINGFVGRRDLLKILGVGGISVAGGLFGQPALAKAASSNPNSISPDRALKQLLEGNQRFVGQSPEYPDQSKARLKEVAQAQHPFATLLTCADSRVPAEIIFDRGIGDIFDVRIAGNIVTPEALGSIEYAVLLLGTPLLMILGHERCGAVTAAIQGEPPTASIASFVKPIQPVVEQLSDKSNLAEAIENAVVANVKYQIERLRQQAPLLVDRERQGSLKIVGGRYDLDTGEVTVLT